MKRDATLSPDAVYRYSLTREWEGAAGRVLFVMLNPSTADASEDDPTIRKCVGYAKRWGYSSLEVVNLYAYRATDPRELRRCGLSGYALRGPDNYAAIEAAGSRSRLVVVAWGVNAHDEAEERHVLRILGHHHDEVWCLGTTKDGKPRHPLMTAYQLPLVPFRAAPAAEELAW